MKVHCKKLLIVTLLGLGMGAMAQTKLVVASKNALETTYDLSTVRAIYFLKDSLKVKITNATPEAFTISAVRKMYFQQSVTGLAESISPTKNDLAGLWPNPAENEINFELRSSEAQVNIYDQTGRSVLTQTLNAFQMRLDISQLPQGFYVAKVTTANESQTISFLKK